MKILFSGYYLITSHSLIAYWSFGTILAEYFLIFIILLMCTFSYLLSLIHYDQIPLFFRSIILLDFAHSYLPMFFFMNSSRVGCLYFSLICISQYNNHLCYSLFLPECYSDSLFFLFHLSIFQDYIQDDHNNCMSLVVVL